MALTPGTRVGPFEILAPIGAGGMGEVYRARDTKLNREVAIKALPDEFAKDGERIARFEREARLLAVLNHPGIATAYGLEESNGLKYLVMELVPGETLAKRLERGAIPFEDALPIFLQIGDALEAAHARGILHRDLKPGNVQLTENGRVKVLDFGLAKSIDGPAESSEPTESPTRTRATELGVILGTASYMSPEQARGKVLDRRSDIWSFGCIVYETLTGKKAFDGEDVTEVLAAIVKSEPDWDALPRDLPWDVVRLLRRCLRKNPEERLRDVGDALLELREARTASSSTEPRRGRTAPWIFLAGAASGALAASLFVRAQREPIQNSKPTARLSITLPADMSATPLNVVLSPDGRQMVFSMFASALPLYHRALDSSDIREISGSRGAGMPAFSPDGKWVAFGRPGGGLWKVPIEGGEPVRLASTAVPDVGLAWGADGYLYYGKTYKSAIYRVPADGGEEESVTELEGDEYAHWWPSVLPDGAAVLYTVYAKGSIDSSEVRIRNLRSGETRSLIRGGYNGRYVASGHVLYGRGGSLLAMAFDRKHLAVSGEPIAVLKSVATSSENASMTYALSEDGTLVYAEESTNDELVWVDRNGAEKPVTTERRSFAFPRVSPDRRKVVVVVREGVDRSLALIDLARGAFTRLTQGYDDAFPAWSVDGEWVYFTSSPKGSYEIFRVRSDGGGEPELVLGGPIDKYTSWVSPDGRFLAFSENPLSEQNLALDIYFLSLDSGEIHPFATGPFNEAAPSFSPDGAWVAYHSDESGRREAYLRRSDGRGGKIGISVDGGAYPIWSKDSSEIFFLNGNRMESVIVPRDALSGLGRPQIWFDSSPYRSGESVASWDTGPGGELLMVRTRQGSQQTELKIVMNWFEELKRLIPTKK